MLILLAAFSVAWLVTFAIVRVPDRFVRLAHDHDLSGPQKIHQTPVARIGGLAIVAGAVAGVLVSWHGSALGLSLVLCALPAFLTGLFEDLTKSVSPRARLLATIVSAVLAVWLIGAVVPPSDLPGLSLLVSTLTGALLLTVLAVSGVTHAVNIIDGFNGLASMCSVIMLGGLAYVAFQVEDMTLVRLALAGIGAALGFFFWNYPAGFVFLGDGGAYFLGFYVAELGILLINRNPEVSPLLPLLVCVYPIFETLFSIYRRGVVRRRTPSIADAIHLHSLIFRRLVRVSLVEGERRRARRNALTSPYLWALCSMSVAPAVLFWYETTVLALFATLFAVGYVLLYWRIVRFKTPSWLVFKAQQRRS